MIHELAHNKQMNHSKAFWAVRNGFMKEIQELLARGYTGEGFYSHGRELGTSHIVQSIALSAEDMPDDLCGGSIVRTRRSRVVRRRRARKRKFEGEGINVGGDLEMRKRLEGGKVNKSAPRVANSDRGRELRLKAAALRAQKLSEERQQAEDEYEETLEEYYEEEKYRDTEDEKKWLHDELEGMFDDKKNIDIIGSDNNDAIPIKSDDAEPPSPPLIPKKEKKDGIEVIEID